MGNIWKGILFNLPILFFPISYFLIVKSLGLKDISRAFLFQLDFPIFLLLIIFGYFILNGFFRKSFVAVSFAHMNLMVLSVEKNPRLFYFYLSIVSICVISLFLHLIYFDLILLTAATFFIWVFLALLCQAILPPTAINEY
ncbi:MAG: hypothetical protein HOE11_02935 [Candidatus Diapherotrites archaeon]|jgi:hypothetical protein|nr:hypothetical protein [Candidatus Diapherotrites archaeon]MBT4597016.1 hypothetical protein [Candidatus Diapherotrites archaeon]